LAHIELEADTTVTDSSFRSGNPNFMIAVRDTECPGVSVMF
jgi:hypothetical protein